MSLIQYQQASYAGRLREQLELAGCETKIATLVARAVGELIDHVSQAEEGMRRDMKEKELQASMRDSSLNAARRDLFDRFVGVTLVVMAAAVASGVLIALLR